MEEQQVNANEWKRGLWKQIKKGKLTQSSIEELLSFYSLKIKDITAFVVAKLCEVDGIENLESLISVALKTIGTTTIKKDQKRKRRECIMTFENLSRLIGPINDDMTALCEGAEGIDVVVPGTMLFKNIHPLFLDHIGVMEELSGHDYSNPTIQKLQTCCRICKKKFYVVGDGAQHVDRFCIFCLNNFVYCKITDREENIKLRTKRLKESCKSWKILVDSERENVEAPLKEAKRPQKDKELASENSKWTIIIPEESSSSSLARKRLIRDVKNALEASKGKEVICVIPIINMEGCLGTRTFPCRGHRGVRIFYKDGQNCTILCDSISIAAIQKSLTGKIDVHFADYDEEFDSIPT